MEQQLGQKRFLWGAALTWLPWVPTLIGLNYALRGISNTKATGLATLAGGLAEGFVWWGVMTMIVGQASAMVLLVRALPGAGALRDLFSVLSILMSALMLALVCGFLLMIWHLH